MRRLFIFLCVLLAATGCDLKQQQQLKQKEEALNAKEQELTARENAVQIKEQDLVAREQKLDSALLQDSSILFDSTLLGLWNVKMDCIETTCTGSAVGDTKTEQWKVSYEENKVVARVMDNGKLVRLYSGKYRGAMLELSVPPADSASKVPAAMVVRVQHTAPDHLEGRREITRAEGCRIIYAIVLDKEEQATTL